MRIACSMEKQISFIFCLLRQFIDQDRVLEGIGRNLIRVISLTYVLLRKFIDQDRVLDEKDVFALFDLDSSGGINFTEFCRLCSSLGVRTDP